MKPMIHRHFSTAALLLAAAALMASGTAHAQTLTGTALNVGYQNNMPQYYNASIGSSNVTWGWGALSLGGNNVNESNSHYMLLTGYANYSYGSSGNSALIGHSNIAYAGTYNSLAVGASNNLRGEQNLAVGGSNTLEAFSGTNPYRSTVLGASNKLRGGNASFVSGAACVSEAADYSATLGYGLINTFDNALIVGKYNDEGGFDPANPPLLVVGNGIDNSDGRSNAFAVFKNGDVSAAGVVRIQPAGDIPMGQFTSGPQ